jgi:hypothetical protein
MPIIPFLRNKAFDPELLKAMSRAFVQACTSLGVSSRADPTTELIARHIIDAAQCGVRTKTALYERAISKIKDKPQ